MSIHRTSLAIPFFLLTMSTASCIIGEPYSEDVDQTAILAQAASFQDPALFEPLSSEPYETALASGGLVDLYSSKVAQDPYQGITPDIDGSGQIIPAGGIIVREVLDLQGTPQGLTIMAKGPAGYNPDIGDWYFAVTDMAGTPVVKDGVTLAGQLTDCYSCHLDREADDFLFGVPMSDR